MRRTFPLSILMIAFVFPQSFAQEQREMEISEVPEARERINKFLDDVKQAYEDKDIDFLEEIYSDALLIYADNDSAYQSDSSGPQADSSRTYVQNYFPKISLEEYLDKIRKIFVENEFITLQFDSVDIRRSADNEFIYGVSTRQSWRASNFEDEDYWFFMFDFSDIEEPLLLIHGWQKDLFQDGSMINLGDFIIEGEKGN